MKRLYRPIFALLGLTLLALPSVAGAQGCILSRQCASVLTALGPYMKRHSYTLSASIRWLDATRHFSGSAEQFKRDTLGSNVENRQRLLDLSGVFQSSRQDSWTLSIPILLHGSWGLKLPSPTASTPGGPQFNQEASGVSDIVLTVKHWVLDVDRAPTGNYSLGLGVKFPTGDPHAMHDFPDRTGQNLMSRAVDWSIQPGTGGWGIVFDFGAFKKSGPVTFYANGVYIAEPLNVNGTPSILNNFGLVTPATEYERYNSAADQYLVRLGGVIPITPIKGLIFSIGARLEGVPIYDLFGGSDGFRRPGHALFIEPGLAWSRGPDTWSINTPVAIDRRRDPDSHGNKGDATFADNIWLLGYSRHFGH